jgi:hypothetical protein
MTEPLGRPSLVKTWVFIELLVTFYRTDLGLFLAQARSVTGRFLSILVDSGAGHGPALSTRKGQIGGMEQH